MKFLAGAVSGVLLGIAVRLASDQVWAEHRRSGGRVALGTMCTGINRRSVVLEFFRF